LVVGDENVKIEKIGRVELQEFIANFNSRFFDDFQSTVQLREGIEMKLPGNDFTINAYNGMDSLAAAKELDVDAVLGINLTLYNEVKPGAMGARVAGAVVTALPFCRYVTERQIEGYLTNYTYLDVETVTLAHTFPYSGKAFPSIDEQRQYFVDMLISYLDRHFPLSADCVPSYTE
jgi:hypothetical protein